MKKVKGTVRAATKKFKGDDPQQITTHECEEILLISGYKREAIDLIMSRLSQDQAALGSIIPPQL